MSAEIQHDSNHVGCYRDMKFVEYIEAKSLFAMMEVGRGVFDFGRSYSHELKQDVGEVVVVVVVDNILVFVEVVGQKVERMEQLNNFGQYLLLHAEPGRIQFKFSFNIHFLNVSRLASIKLLMQKIFLNQNLSVFLNVFYP